NDRRKPVVLASGLAQDAAYDRHVVILQAAAKAVRHQLLGHRLDKALRTLEERGSKPRDADHSLAVGHRALRVHLVAGISRPPRTNGVEVLEREPERVHRPVTARA